MKLPKEIIEREVRAICGRYKIEPDKARRFLEQDFYGRPGLVNKILKRYPDEDVTRLKEYKAVIKGVRKKVYYHLRQYQPDTGESGRLRELLGQHVAAGERDQAKQVVSELLLTHVSTRERANAYPDFYKKLFELIEPPRRILDVGCGIHPLSYPFGEPEICPEIYTALDKSRDATDCLKTYIPLAKPARLIPVCDNIAGIRWSDYLTDGIGMYDIAFMLKLIPVISRQERAALSNLIGVPARNILITASAEAMTRRSDIRRREERLLRRFISLARGEILGEISVKNEFGYLVSVSKPPAC